MLSLILPCVILFLWWIATTFTDMSHALLPSIPEVWNTFCRFLEDGTLVSDLSRSIRRVLKGYLIAAALGLTLGSAMGMWPVLRQMVQPLLTAVRQIPVIAWIPLIILWSGIGELSKIIVIAIAAFFPVTVNTLSGIQAVPEGYLEVAKLYRLNRWQTFRKVCFPCALGQILTGCKLGLGSAWMAVVAAELIASSSGIGYRLNYARGLLQSDAVILCMIVIGLIGIIFDGVLTLLFAHFLSWKKKS